MKSDRCAVPTAKRRTIGDIFVFGALVALVAALASQQGCKSPEELAKEKEEAAKKSQTAQQEQQQKKQPTDADSQHNPPLRYGFEKGKAYAYRVQIEIDLGDFTRAYDGLVEFEVRNADNFEIVLDKSSFLQPGIRHADRIVPSGWISRRGVYDRPPQHDNSLTIDHEGKVLQNHGSVELPFMFGDLSTVVIEPLASKQDSWTEEHTIQAGTQISGGLMPPGSANPPPNPFGPSPPPMRYGSPPLSVAHTSSYVTSGTRRVEYHRTKPIDNAVKIEKQFELECKAVDASGPVAIDVSGKGYVVFDLADGVLTKGRMTHTIKLAANNGVKTIPFLLTYNRLSQQELAERDERLANARAEFKTRTEAAKARIAEQKKPLDIPQTEALLKELGGRISRISALNRLSQGPANEMRAEVARALEQLLNDKGDGLTPPFLMDAMEVWATKESVPTLIAVATDGKSISDRHDAIKILGLLQDDRAIEVLANGLLSSQDRYAAEKALLVMGPVAEGRVLLFLDSDDQSLRHVACKILKAVGTRKSLPRLQTIADGDSIVDATYAKEAIREISARP